MREITLEELLEAGCHFGHQVTRSNPKARDFIFEARDGIHIIDLAKTKEGLDDGAKFLKLAGQNPAANLVVVGTKRQAHEILNKEIDKIKGEIKGDSGLFFVTNKWIGGLLTNFSEVSKNFKKLKDFMYKLETPSEQAGFTKKEVGGWAKEKEKLQGFYGGVYELTKKPDILFIIDAHLEALAVKEARAMDVPTIAIVDTNADPALVDYPIPANDDAVGSLQLIISYILEAWAEGRNASQNQKSSIRQAQDKNLKSQKSTSVEVLADKEETKAPEAKAEQPRSESSGQAKKEAKVKTEKPKAEKKTKTV
ncbi:MAG: 30S ribosomal protein S2 [Patescibacteria group bacterium]